jgi:hypothetical protein
MNEAYTVEFFVPDRRRELKFFASTYAEALQYYVMIREVSGVQYARLFDAEKNILESWRKK